MGRRKRKGRPTVNAHPWRNHCASGKIAYRHPDTAELAANRSRLPARHYRCELCDLWHITTQPLEKRRRA